MDPPASHLPCRHCTRSPPVSADEASESSEHGAAASRPSSIRWPQGPAHQPPELSGGSLRCGLEAGGDLSCTGDVSTASRSHTTGQGWRAGAEEGMDLVGPDSPDEAAGGFPGADHVGHGRPSPPPAQGNAGFALFPATRHSHAHPSGVLASDTQRLNAPLPNPGCAPSTASCHQLHQTLINTAALKPRANQTFTGSDQLAAGTSSSRPWRQDRRERRPDLRRQRLGRNFGDGG